MACFGSFVQKSAEITVQLDHTDASDDTRRSWRARVASNGSAGNEPSLGDGGSTMVKRHGRLSRWIVLVARFHACVSGRRVDVVRRGLRCPGTGIVMLARIGKMRGFDMLGLASADACLPEGECSIPRQAKPADAMRKRADVREIDLVGAGHWRCERGRGECSIPSNRRAAFIVQPLGYHRRWSSHYDLRLLCLTATTAGWMWHTCKPCPSYARRVRRLCGPFVRACKVLLFCVMLTDDLLLRA